MKELHETINPGSAEEFVTAMKLRFEELAAAHQAQLCHDEAAVFARLIGGPVTHEASLKANPQFERPNTFIL